MCKYWEAEKDKSLTGKRIFLLRSLSRGAGVGFFEKQQGFYPDFILRTQRIVFIEPQGMVYARAYEFDEKVQLHERLADLARKISERSKITNVSSDSFIISATPYEELREHYDDKNWDRAKFAQKHILFPECSKEYDYMKIITPVCGIETPPCGPTPQEWQQSQTLHPGMRD